MRFLFLLSIALFQLQVAANAQSKDSIRLINIKEYPDHFFIWPVFKQRSLSFDITERLTQDQRLRYRPNTSINAGIGLYLFEVAIELTTAIPLNEKSIQRFGESDARDLQANILGRNFGFDLMRQEYSGFYLTDSENPIQNNQPAIQRPDIKVKNAGISGIYVLNKNRFSLRSAYNFAERQLRSRGSWVITGTMNNFQMDAAANVLTNPFELKVGEESAFQKLHYTTLSVAPGYSQNLVFRQFFLNTTFSLGPAHHWIYHQRKDGSDHFDIAVNTFVDLRVSLGYSSDRFFGGINFVQRSQNVRFESVQFTNATSTFKIVMGYRFLERGLLKKRLIDLVPFR